MLFVINIYIKAYKESQVGCIDTKPLYPIRDVIQIFR